MPPNQIQILFLHKLSGAFVVSRETQLVIGTVLLGRISLATTGRLATHVVLLRQDAWKQLRTEPEDLLFGPLDSFLERLSLDAHGNGIIA